MVIRLSDKSSLELPVRLPDQVAEILTSEIEGGGVRPGDILPTEAALSRRFGVSRSVIREALSRLKHDGLLASRQGKGVTVVGPSGRRTFRLAGVDKLTPGDVAQLYELRTILEGEAAALAAVRRSREDLARLRRSLSAMADAVQKDADGTSPDLDFHQSIARASGNVHLGELMQFLNDKIVQVIGEARSRSRRQPGLPAAVLREHEAVLRAIRKRDPLGARSRTLEHLTNAARRMGLEPPRTQEPPGAEPLPEAEETPS